MLSPASVTYILSAVAVPLVIHFGLLPADLAGLAVHVLTAKLASRLPARWGGFTHNVALAVIVILVVIALLGSGLGLAWFLDGSGGMAALLKAAAETLEKVKRSLPADVSDLYLIRWKIYERRLPLCCVNTHIESRRLEWPG